MKRLTERDNVCSYIGTYGSSLAMAGGEVGEKAGVPGVGTSCTNPLVTQGKKYYFRACFIDPYQGAAAATYAFKNLGMKKAAILMDVANACREARCRLQYGIHHCGISRHGVTVRKREPSHLLQADTSWRCHATPLV